MNLSNPVKQKLRDGEAVLGSFVPIPSPEVVEICALAGFDFILIDAEHGPVDPHLSYAMILAAEAHDTPIFARIGENDRQVILKYLDLGIAGVMIPQVTTPEAAEEAVAALKYAPRGQRGIAGGRTFDWGIGEAPKDLVPRINERVLSIVQFEHVGAFDALDAILDTPDMDVLFVGPNDLAQSMGYPGQPNHPEAQAVIDRVVEKAQGAPVALGTVAFDAASAKAQIDRGFQMVVTNAPALLARASRDLLGSVRGA